MAKLTKAARARRLAKNGHSVYAIAKKLKARYMFIRVTLIRAGLLKKQLPPYLR
jgi:hypothetical protein